MTRVHPFNAHLHEAGFAPGADQRIARSAGAEARARAGAIARAQRDPVSEARTELPDEFIGPAVARVEILMRHGNWEMAETAVRRIAAEWQLWQTERMSLASRPLADRLAAHVNTLNLPTRTVEILEARAIFTIGSLLESFPEKLIGARNCGPETIRNLAGVLDGSWPPPRAETPAGPVTGRLKLR